MESIKNESNYLVERDVYRPMCGVWVTVREEIELPGSELIKSIDCMKNPTYTEI